MSESIRLTGHVYKRLQPISGQEYTIQFPTDLTLGSWQTPGVQAGGLSGMISIIDHPPAGSPKRFYRMLLP